MIMKSYVILLNWNGWKDTIECLESVFRLNADFRVVVCDNASTDGSIEKIKIWAEGKLPVNPANHELARLVLPPCPKPVSCIVLTREQAEAGASPYEERLILVDNGANLGFAGGNNIGLRYALRDSECEYIWLLNNDTIVEPDALSALLKKMQENAEVGLCGSLSRSYENPDEIQTNGGKGYNLWTARVRNSPATTNGYKHSQQRLDFISGASTLVSRNFLERVGLMEESYFLFFEELDWAMRAKGRFSLSCTSDSVIYHKEGASIGSHPDRRKRSMLSDQYLSRSRVLFTKRFFPWALPTVIASICVAAADRLLHGDPERFKAILSYMVQGLVTPVSK